MLEPNFENTLNDPWFFFWTVITYLIILFHSWRIKEIWTHIKGAETLFLSGALGYAFLIISRYLIFPIIEFVPKWLQNFNLAFNSLPFFVIHKGNEPPVQSFIEYYFFGVSFLVTFYLMSVGVAILIIKIIRYCLDPNKEVFPKYQRFIVLDKYKVTRLLGFGIPTILVFSSVIILAIGVMIDLLTKMKSISPNFWSIIDVFSAIFGGIASMLLIYFSIIIIYSNLKLLYPILFETSKRIQIYYTKFKDERESEQKQYIRWFGWFERHNIGLMIVLLIWMTLISLTKVKEGEISLIQFGLMWFLPLIIILIIPKKWLHRINLKTREYFKK